MAQKEGVAPGELDSDELAQGVVQLLAAMALPPTVMHFTAQPDDGRELMRGRRSGIHTPRVVELGMS